MAYGCHVASHLSARMGMTHKGRYFGTKLFPMWCFLYIITTKLIAIVEIDMSFNTTTVAID